MESGVKDPQTSTPSGDKAELPADPLPAPEPKTSEIQPATPQGISEPQPGVDPDELELDYEKEGEEEKDPTPTKSEATLKETPGPKGAGVDVVDLQDSEEEKTTGEGKWTPRRTRSGKHSASSPTKAASAQKAAPETSGGSTPAMFIFTGRAEFTGGTTAEQGEEVMLEDPPRVEGVRPVRLVAPFDPNVHLPTTWEEKAWCCWKHGPGYTPDERERKLWREAARAWVGDKYPGW